MLLVNFTETTKIFEIFTAVATYLYTIYMHDVHTYEDYYLLLEGGLVDGTLPLHQPQPCASSSFFSRSGKNFGTPCSMLIPEAIFFSYRTNYFVCKTNKQTYVSKRRETSHFNKNKKNWKKNLNVKHL